MLSYLPAYAVDQLHISVSMVGIAVTMHYLTDTVVKGWIGYLMDHFSFRLIVQGGLFISLLGLIAIPYSHQGWLLILTSSVFGVGMSTIWIVCLSKVKEENRAMQMGLLYTFWFIGMGLGPVIFNFLIEWSYQLSFGILVVLWMIGWGVTWNISNQGQVEMKSIPFSTQLKLLWQRLKTLRALVPGMILQTMAAGMLVPILPHFTTKHLGLSHSNTPTY